MFAAILSTSLLSAFFAIFGLLSIDSDLMKTLDLKQPWIYYAIMFGYAVAFLFLAIALKCISDRHQEQANDKKITPFSHVKGKKGFFTNIFYNHPAKIAVCLIMALLFPGYMFLSAVLHDYGVGNKILSGIITGIIFWILSSKMTSYSFEIIDTYFKPVYFAKKKEDVVRNKISSLYYESRYDDQLRFIYISFLVIMAAESLLFVFLVDSFCIAFLIACAVLFLGFSNLDISVYAIEDKYIISKLGSSWKEYTCPHCTALGCEYKGYQNYQQGDYRLKQTHSTDHHKAYINGETIYYTTMSTNTSLQRDYRYDAIYYCSVCNKYYKREKSGTKNL